MKLYIKNTVCDRCILVIIDLMDELGMNPLSIDVGVVYFGALKLHNPVQY